MAPRTARGRRRSRRSAARAQHTEAVEALKTIAAKHLGIDKLECVGSDRLDFVEVSRDSVKLALEAAFEAGRIAAQRKVGDS